MSPAVRRRFWTGVRVERVPGGFGVALDQKPLTTPGKQPLVMPTAAFAERVAAEWDAVDTEIDPGRLPFTRVANTAIDRVAQVRSEVIDELVAYGETDLICYRAHEPEELRERQIQGWDRWLDWSREVLGAELQAVTGIGYRAQPEAAVAALRREVSNHDPFELVPLHDLVTLSGSLVLGLAVSRRALGAAAAWPLSRIDEEWQEEQWGRDDWADSVAAQKRDQFLFAETALECLRNR